jgi:hypothetical protein
VHRRARNIYPAHGLRRIIALLFAACVTSTVA